MKKLITLLLLIPLFSHAQLGELELAESDDMRDKKINFKEFVGEKDGLVYVLAGKSWDELIIQAYDKNTMELDHEVELDEIEDPIHVAGALNGESIYPAKNGVYLLRYGYEKETKSIGIFKRTIDWDGTSSGYEKVFDVGRLPTISVTQDALVMESSPDNSKIMVYSYPHQPSAKRPVQVVVFNSDFEELYRSPLSSPFKNGLAFTPTQFSVDNDGGVYVLGYSKKARKEGELDPQDEITEHYGVFKVNESGIVKVLDLAGKGRVYHDLFMSLNDGGIELLGLFLSNQKTYESEHIFMKLDHSLTIYEEATSKFNQNVLDYFDFDPKTKEKYKYSGVRKSTLKGFLRFRQKDLMRWADGTYTVVAEREVSSGLGIGNFFDEILLLNLSADGKIRNGEVIDVYQAELTAFSSYVAHQGKDKVYVLFNDDTRNEERIKEGKEPIGLYIRGGYASKANTRVASFDKSGKLEYKTIRVFKERYSCLRTAFYLDMGKEEAAFQFGPQNDREPGGEHIVRIRFR